MEADRSVAAGDSGYAMAALLVGMAIISVAMSVALPTWSTQARREREAELIFRGEQYAHAIALYQRKYANAMPPSFDILIDQRFLRRRYKDPMSKDGEFRALYAGSELPGQAAAQGGAGRGAAGQNGIVPQQGQRGAGSGLAGSGALGQAPGQSAQGGLTGVPAGGQGGIVGVVSKSEDMGMRLYNGREGYSEWTFMATQATTRAGAPNGSQTPTGGIPGRGQGPGVGVPNIGGPGRGGPGQNGSGRQGPGINGPGGGQQGPPPSDPFGGQRGGSPFGGFQFPPGRGR